MVDGGIIVGYLAAALLRGARRVADRGVEALFDRLIDVVQDRLGQRPIDQLERDPAGGVDVVRGNIEAALRSDPAFAREVAALVAELDHRGARKLINEVRANINVQAFDHGIAVGRDLNFLNAPDPTDLSGAHSWVKVCYVLGVAAVVLAGAIFGYTLLTDRPDLGDPDFGQTPGGIVVAGAVFGVGFVIFAAAAVGHSLSRKQ